MTRKILLTSFTTWEPHHISNASDDLLELFGRTCPLPVHYLRRLPVDFELASRQVLDRFQMLRPDITVLCGMAERRNRLEVESRAVVDDEVLTTPLDLESLTAGLSLTGISHDAGRFVCNELYYRMLRHHRDEGLVQPCLFVHVPLLTAANREAILGDFRVLVDRLVAHSPGADGTPADPR